MKQITKAAEPERFSKWKQQNIPLGMGYKNLHGEVKSDLHDTLLAEQGAICCYCEQRICKNDSHIEHFRPQGKFPQLALEYQNLLCSCQLPHHQKPKEPRHCGLLKDQWFADTLISPLDADCDQHFRFAADGSIYPDDDSESAKTTIKKLGLDIDKLCKLRASALQALEDLPKDKIQKILDDPGGKQFQPSYTTIRQILA